MPYKKDARTIVGGTQAIMIELKSPTPIKRTNWETPKKTVINNNTLRNFLYLKYSNKPYTLMAKII